MNLPATPSAHFLLYRHDRAGMVRDNVRGEWVRLNDARWALQGMQSELESLRSGARIAGPDARLQRQAHQHNGDMLRIWQIIGDPNQQGMRQDLFQRLGRIMDELAMLREFYRRQKAAEGTEHDTERLPPPDPPRLTGG